MTTNGFWVLYLKKQHKCRKPTQLPWFRINVGSVWQCNCGQRWERTIDYEKNKMSWSKQPAYLAPVRTGGY